MVRKDYTSRSEVGVTQQQGDGLGFEYQPIGESGFSASGPIVKQKKTRLNRKSKRFDMTDLIKTHRHHTVRRRLENIHSGVSSSSINYWELNKCDLLEYAHIFQADKITAHSFGDIYCEILRKYRYKSIIQGEIKRKKLRMLEIGLGCGHHIVGAGANMFKKYFTEDGPGLEL